MVAVFFVAFVSSGWIRQGSKFSLDVLFDHLFPLGLFLLVPAVVRFSRRVVELVERL